MPWQLSVVIHLVLSTGFALLYRNFAKNNKGRALLTMAVMYLLTITPIGFIWASAQGGVSFAFAPSMWGFLVLGGVLFAVGNVLAFVANTHVDAAQFSIITNTRTVTTIAVSSVLLHELLTPLQGVGVALIIVAALWFALGRRTEKTKKLSWYSLIAVLSAVLMGIGISNEKYLLDNMSFSTYLVVGWGFQTLAMVIIAGRQWKHIRAFLQENRLVQVIALGLLRTFAGLALVWTLARSGNSSLVASIISYKTALVVVLAYFVLRERQDAMRKLLGAGVATAGILLLL